MGNTHWQNIAAAKEPQTVWTHNAVKILLRLKVTKI